MAPHLVWIWTDECVSPFSYPVLFPHTLMYYMKSQILEEFVNNAFFRWFQHILLMCWWQIYAYKNSTSTWVWICIHKSISNDLCQTIIIIIMNNMFDMNGPSFSHCLRYQLENGFSFLHLGPQNIYIYPHVYTLHITHFLYMECICLDMTMSNIHTAYYLYVFYTLNICNASCIWLIYINVVLNWCHGQNNHLTMCCDSVMQRSICCWMRPFWCSGRASRLLKWQNEQQQQQPHSHNFECDFCCCCACCCWCC